MSRVNTFSLNFAEVPDKLSSLDYHKFVQERLELKYDEVISFGIYGKKIFIKVSSQELFMAIFEKYEGKLSYQAADKTIHHVQMENESAKSIVKIHRIPIEVAENEIKTAFTHYGVIESIRNDYWRDLPYKCYNDTKIIKMEIKRAIPSYVIVGGRQYWVTHLGQIRTCRRCGSTEHERLNCDKTTNNRFRSYANVTSNSTEVSLDDRMEKTNTMITEPEQQLRNIDPETTHGKNNEDEADSFSGFDSISQTTSKTNAGRLMTAYNLKRPRNNDQTSSEASGDEQNTKPHYKKNNTSWEKEVETELSLGKS